MPGNAFTFNFTVYLKDTNLFGNVYFSRYFEWQGMAREAYFQTVKDYQKIMRSGIKLITKKASTVYEHECTAFENIIITIRNKGIKRFSFTMVFTIQNSDTNVVLARGEQMIGFADQTGNLMMIPKEILEVISRHTADPSGGSA